MTSRDDLWFQQQYPKIDQNYTSEYAWQMSLASTPSDLIKNVGVIDNPAVEREVCIWYSLIELLTAPFSKVQIIDQSDKTLLAGQSLGLVEHDGYKAHRIVLATTFQVRLLLASLEADGAAMMVGSASIVEGETLDVPMALIPDILNELARKVIARLNIPATQVRGQVLDTEEFAQQEEEIARFLEGDK